MDSNKPQKYAQLTGAGINLPADPKLIALHKESNFLSETSKRELVIAFAAAVMLILFFVSGTG